MLINNASEPVQVKSGSGDMRVRHAEQDVALSTASGDLVIDEMHRGQLAAKNVSGDIRVGIPAGIPVWTDISSMTGSVRSDLEGAGEPAEGQDFIEVRAKTISGDVFLEQLEHPTTPLASLAPPRGPRMRVTWIWAAAPDDEPGLSRSAPQRRSGARRTTSGSVDTTTPGHTRRSTERNHRHV